MKPILMIFSISTIFFSPFQGAITGTQMGCFSSVTSPFTSSFSSHWAPLLFFILGLYSTACDVIGSVLGDLTNPLHHPRTTCSAQSPPMLCQEIEMRSYPTYPIIHPPNTHTQTILSPIICGLLLWLLVLVSHNCTHICSVVWAIQFLLPYMHWLETHTHRNTYTDQCSIIQLFIVRIPETKDKAFIRIHMTLKRNLGTESGA